MMRGPWRSRHSPSPRLARSVEPVLVNGAAGVASWLADGGPLSVRGFTVRRGRVVAIDILADPARLGQFNLTVPNN
jgi:hypothetical protein